MAVLIYNFIMTTASCHINILAKKGFFDKQEDHVLSLMDEFGLTRRRAEIWAEREAQQLNLY